MWQVVVQSVLLNLLSFKVAERAELEIAAWALLPHGTSSAG